MTTLNIMCVICNEFYKPTDTVFSTTECGHLFHKQCLFRWLTTSQTCPQCRHPCHTRRVHRVFLNFSEPTEFDDFINEDVPDWQILDLPPGHGPHIPPANALQSGSDLEGNEVYVARAAFKGDMLPANYIPLKGIAFVPWGCNAHALSCEHIEYLVDDGRYSWVPAANGTVPELAVIVGFTETGENLYTGRANHNGVTFPGKVHPSHKVLYMPNGGLEENTNEYEVLIRFASRPEAPVVQPIQGPPPPTIPLPILLPEPNNQQQTEQEPIPEEEE